MSLSLRIAACYRCWPQWFPINPRKNMANIHKHSLMCTDAANGQQSIKRTALHDFHLEHGAKMVPFAGFSMPLKYDDLSIVDSHLHTRSDASLFDVSHMLQLKITGKDRVRFFESLVVADVENLPVDGATLTLYTNESGGIIDDLIVSKKSDSLYIVSNASRIKEDMEHLRLRMSLFIQNNAGSDLEYQILDDKSLLALQGPKAAEQLQKNVAIDLSKLKFMNGVETRFKQTVPIRITRCGYTGEDGFEIQIPNDHVAKVADTLIQSPVVKMAGLGARDSLRLEAGLCLYGQDINMDTTPVEAVLAWTIAKRRRAEANFPGAKIILEQLKQKPKTKRIGLIGVGGGPPARTGCLVYKEPIVSESNLVGRITSGCPSPSLKKNIAMGYLKNDDPKMVKIGNKLYCEIRGKLYEYQITKMPFVPAKYFI